MNREKVGRLAEDPEIRDDAAAAVLAKVRLMTREAKPGEIPEAVADQIQDAVAIEALREMLQAAEHNARNEPADLWGPDTDAWRWEPTEGERSEAASLFAETGGVR
jgi:hypothetical protein